MALGEIQLGEVVVVGFDIGTFGNCKTHVGENGRQLICYLADGMHAAGFGRRFGDGQCDVDGFGVESRVKCSASKLVFCSRDGRGETVL